MENILQDPHKIIALFDFYGIIALTSESTVHFKTLDACLTTTMTLIGTSASVNV